jgi:opacity protein-like surface antigen
MVSVKVTAFAGVAALMATTAAKAADMPQLMPPPIPIYEDFARGWYLRGDIGMTNQQVKTLDNILFAGTPNLVIQDKNFESGMLFGIGVGYQFNNWFRVDLTGEYRGETGFHGLDTWTDTLGNPRFNNYTAKKSEWLVLANVYADLGTWGGVTPFVGFGIGGSRNTIHSFRDMGIDEFGSPTLGFANAASKWNFAWALHAGVGYKLTPNATLEFSYRYVDLGDGITGDIVTYTGANAVNNPMHFKDITSHDFRLGLRWMLDAGPKYEAPKYFAPAPRYYEPPPAYHQPPPPPPAYHQPPAYEPYPPPVMRRG